MKPIDNAAFIKAVDEAIRGSTFEKNPKFRFAVESVARELLVMAQWSEISPPAISPVALSAVFRYAWDTFEVAR